jgi:CcmD family protein
MMEAQGKIYVVALVLAIILIGIAFFLFFIERKLSNLEKKVETLSEDNEGASVKDPGY